VLEFRVVPALGLDDTTPPRFLALPAISSLPAPDRVRPLALIEMMGMGADPEGDELEGPVEAMLGTVEDGTPSEKEWSEPVTENPALHSTEVWEFYNTTGDAHPIHVHEVAFQVVNRQRLLLDDDEEAVLPLQLDGEPVPPEPWETGFKDTVTALPGQVTRVRATFDVAGQYVWHCHIIEHEDNEMMRPFRVGERQPRQPD
jgi:FtsP/CotA-like multicopper oxidase with cupredoxin domain